jgi:hypothetical protein
MSGMPLMSRANGSSLASVSTTVAAERHMRAVADWKGFVMATPTPLTARVVAMIADGRERAKIAFLANGILEPHEAHALAAIDDALVAAEAADLARKTARSMEDTGELTAWQQRQWREMHRDHFGPQAA